jgi:hypothetical protein
MIFLRCPVRKMPVGIWKGAAAALLTSIACIPVSLCGNNDDSPELPRVYLDTSAPAQSGRVLAVARDCKDLQARIDVARPGDTVEIPPGAVCVGNYVLPRKAAASGWIVIRTAGADTVFPQGVRVSPAGADRMASVLTPNSRPAVATAAGANHYRLVGLEIGTQPSPRLTINYGIVTLGDGSREQDALDKVPSDLIVDRCYIHGSPMLNVSRGVALNSARTALIDSYISEIHGAGFDTQAAGGWNGPGPFKITNNYLEASGENLMFGGGRSHLPQLVPSDIEIRANYLFKPLRWNRSNAAYAGKHWTVKNLLEFKNAQRVLCDGNVLENNWVDAQNGFAILFTVRTEDGAMPWGVVQDVTFTNNILRNSPSGVNILGTDTNELGKSRRILIRNNVLDNLGPGAAFQLLAAAEHIDIDHNTVKMNESRAAMLLGGKPQVHLAYTNNLVSETRYGIFGSGVGSGKPAIERYAPAGVFQNNSVLHSSRQNADTAAKAESPGADMHHLQEATRNAISGNPAGTVMPRKE